MAATMIFRGELPPQGAVWCVICTRLYKGAFLELESTQVRIQEANAMSEDEKVVFDMSKWPAGVPKPILEEAVTTSMVLLAHQVPTPAGVTVANVPYPAPTCWTHAPGLQVKDGVLGYSAADLPAEKGAVLLGQGRRQGG